MREEVLVKTRGSELIKIADNLGIKVNCNKERTQLKEAKGNVIKKILKAEKELEEAKKKEAKKTTKKATKKAKTEKTAEELAEIKARRKATKLEKRAAIMEQTKALRESDAYKFNGKTQSLTEWSKELGILRKDLYRRIHYRGWSIEKAFTTK
jgi:hypothetical protein